MLLNETFVEKSLNPELRWHCEPARWRVDPSLRVLRVEPEANTDFWQRTHYGFSADNGHFLYCQVSSDFTLTTHVRFQPAHQYDQAGLMVRLSPSCWLKTSVEFEPDGPSRLGAVVTNFAYSDWSTQDIPADIGEVWLRVQRVADDYTVQASLDGQHWTQLRVAHLHEGADNEVACGLYACSPQGAGFVAEFTSLTLDAAGAE